MKTIVLDTNFLLLPDQYGIDVFSELERLVPEGRLATLSNVISELEAISRSNSKDGSAAKVALMLLEKKNVEVIPAEGLVDDAIVEYAAKSGAIIATNDKGLKNRLKGRVGLISMKGKNHLDFI